MMRTVGRRVSLWAPPVAYATVIYVLSSQSDPLPQVTSLVWDKALHTVEYSGLGFFVCRAMRGEGINWPISVTCAAIVAASFGASDEWHQSGVAERIASASDWIADAVGSTLGSVAHWFVNFPRPLTLKAWRTEN